MTGRAVIYARVSSDEQRNNYSIPTQVAECLMYAKTAGYAVIGDQWVDPVTGQDASPGDGRVRAYVDDYTSRELNRPSLDAAQRFLENMGFDVLLVYSLDRLARDARFALELMDSGVLFKFADMPDIDNSTPQGRFFITQFAAMAELEAAIISERTKAALAAAKRRGVKLGSPNPAKGGSVTGAQRASATAQVAPQAMPIINALRKAGQSLRAIASALNEAQIPTAMGGQWHASSVRNLINA